MWQDAVGQRSETVRRANLSAIVRELHARGPLSRSELVVRTGLTRSAIRGLIGGAGSGGPRHGGARRTAAHTGPPVAPRPPQPRECGGPRPRDRRGLSGRRPRGAGRGKYSATSGWTVRTGIRRSSRSWPTWPTSRPVCAAGPRCGTRSSASGWPWSASCAAPTDSWPWPRTSTGMTCRSASGSLSSSARMCRSPWPTTRTSGPSPNCGAARPSAATTSCSSRARSVSVAV